MTTHFFLFRSWGFFTFFLRGADSHDFRHSWSAGVRRVLVPLACLLWFGVPALPAEEACVYEAGFERAGTDALFALGITPEGLNRLDTCGARILEQGPDNERITGRKSYRMVLVFRGDGYANPILSFPRPVPVNGPLYFSCYYKIVEQDPESSHNIGLIVWGEYPKDPQPTLGKLSTVEPSSPDPAYANSKPVWKGANIGTPWSEPVKDGWNFCRTDNIQAVMNKRGDIKNKDGMCLFAVSVSITGCRAGRRLVLFLNDLRLTRQMPMVPPSPERVAEAEAFFARVGDEYRELAGHVGNDETKAKNAALFEKVAESSSLIGKEGIAGPGASSLVGLMPEFEKSYYTLKLLEMSGN